MLEYVACSDYKGQIMNRDYSHIATVCLVPVALLLIAPAVWAGAWFSDVSTTSGVDDSHDSFIFGTGQAWIDVENDGDLDLFVSNRDGPNHLYINQGNGQFTEPAQFASMAMPSDRGTGVAVGDYDNDGWQDLYVAVDGENRLFRNQAGQSFVEVGAAAGVNNPHNSQVATWADVNQDGFLDLYVGNYRAATDADVAEGSDIEVPDAFYINQGDGTFIDVADQLDPIETHKPALAVAFLDFDHDDDLDLYVVNDRLWGNTLWRNDGPSVAGCPSFWCFTDVSEATGADRPVFGMGIAIADYDHDGDDDLYFSSIGEQVLLQSQWAQGQAVYVEKSMESGLDFDSSGWATLFIDVDNDSYHDAYLATYGTTQEAADQFYINQRDGTFQAVSATSGIQSLTRSEGAAMGDYDNDGLLDVIVSDMGSQFHLYRNISDSTHNWVSFELNGGDTINQDAIGAIVTLTDTSGQDFRQVLMSGGSRGAGNQLRLHFGLGGEGIMTARVRWPNGVEHALTSTLNAINQVDYLSLQQIHVDGFE